LERWRDELTARLSPDDAWRLLLGSATNALLSVADRPEAARILRKMADLVEAGKPPQLN
jgi:hypothetical protein